MVVVVVVVVRGVVVVDAYRRHTHACLSNKAKTNANQRTPSDIN